jgi:hypothetical protein
MIRVWRPPGGRWRGRCSDQSLNVTACDARVKDLPT